MISLDSKIQTFTLPKASFSIWVYLMLMIWMRMAPIGDQLISASKQHRIHTRITGWIIQGKDWSIAKFLLNL